jgi:drug/metabolite transporter (DMT)-like permease
MATPPPSSRIPPQLFLWIAVLIFGASGAVTRRLSELGASLATMGHNPISLCNVLFVGNLCALGVLLVLYGKELQPQRLSQLTGGDWGLLAAIALLSGALAPGLVFDALANTPVNNVILIGRLEPPLVLALSVWALGDGVNRWQVMGAVVSLVGIVLTVTLQGFGSEMAGVELSLGRGELFTAIAAVAVAISTILTKKQSPRVTLGVNSVVRTAIGTSLFFLLALILYGQNHFMELFTPFLWQWMLLYGTVIVVVGQSAWVAGLRQSSAATASLVGSFTPIAGIIAAYLILGEAPTPPQIIGGAIVIAGLVLSQIGTQKSLRRASNSEPLSPSEIEAEMGFRGV